MTSPWVLLLFCLEKRHVANLIIICAGPLRSAHCQAPRVIYKLRRQAALFSMTHLSSANVVLSAATFFTIIIITVLRTNRRSGVTKLKGPTSKSFLLGYSKELLLASEHSDVIEAWETQYGSVYQVPTVLGMSEIVLCDPKAILHYYSSDTYTYQQIRSVRYLMETFVSCWLNLCSLVSS